MHQLRPEGVGEFVVICGLLGFIVVGVKSVGFRIGFVVIVGKGLFAVGTVVIGVVMSICLVEILNDS